MSNSRLKFPQPSKNIFITAIMLFLTACTTPLPQQPVVEQLLQDKNERAAQLAQLTSWTIKGKIAFIEGDDKQSANLYWQQDNNTLQLKLTSFLGVNVLTLSSANEQHVLTANGKTYTDDNLEDLLNQVSAIRLPVKALSYWLKGLKAQTEDVVLYSQTTQLPETLNAWVNHTYWHIDYQQYNLVNNYRLANKISIKHRDLTIKIAIHHWDID
ncbi:lipoprotein insertase outer membrane protein LolB [Thalassotalea sp. ND16A]|uniref:lipoprotein insertase outer membrane protein LolB n=1 Tax=Thalassotalea sp. ND16A TaxID=1535422 RepID=UPI00051D7C30|nr:lipoprotein insertase outer membrane protein LolB [Thalassotalea sp. ND16A]KGJ95757.1 hypothetical protein ND16A_1292 [Thalassotalea sp. ND16A]